MGKPTEEERAEAIDRQRRRLLQALGTVGVASISVNAVPKPHRGRVRQEQVRLLREMADAIECGKRDILGFESESYARETYESLVSKTFDPSGISVYRIVLVAPSLYEKARVK
jgi:hypothetical protein